MPVQSFFRPVLRENFPMYAPSVPWDGKALKLDSGENLWAQTLTIDWDAISSRLACYPDAAAWELRESLAADIGVDPSCIAVGNGSDELIDLCCRVFLDRGDRLLDFTPTFPMFSFFGRLSGASIVDIPRLADFQLDVPRVKRELSTAKLAFVANPNNPTGTLITCETIKELLAIGTPLVVDEAYVEFSGESVVDLVSEFENLIVLRTFSKWAGIAGVRIGWMVANPLVIEKILSIKPPYSVNAVAQAIAVQVLQNKGLFAPCLTSLIQSRDWFTEEVATLPGLNTVPSKASCVCIQSDCFDITAVANALRDVGIIVKVLPESLMRNTIRCSVAPKEEMQKVVQALREYSRQNR